jgi:hypothetical protein
MAILLMFLLGSLLFYFRSNRIASVGPVAVSDKPDLCLAQTRSSGFASAGTLRGTPRIKPRKYFASTKHFATVAPVRCGPRCPAKRLHNPNHGLSLATAARLKLVAHPLALRITDIAEGDAHELDAGRATFPNAFFNRERFEAAHLFSLHDASLAEAPKAVKTRKAPNRPLGQHGANKLPATFPDNF